MLRPLIELARTARRRDGARLRSATIALLGAAGAVGFLVFHDGISPVRRWFVWDLLALWGWQVLLATAFVSTGHLLITRVFRVTGASGIETLSLSAAVGAVAFVVGMYAGGFLRLYGPVFAVALPVILVAAGARPLWTAARVALRAREAPTPRPRLLTIAAWALGGVGLGLVYLGLLSPDAVNYDASWMHLAIAQDYGREGRIVPFPADWVKNVPHLASVINTWSFILPGLAHPAQRAMSALHTEFAFLLWTLVHITALARWLTEDRRAPAAWVMFFLFPAIFVYDSNLGGAADHFLAFFAAPLFLAGVRAADSLSPRAWALTGTLAAAVVLTKLQGVYLLPAVGLVIAARSVRAAFARRRAEGVRGWAWLQPLFVCPAVALACMVAVTALHFGKNWVFYGNPFYPFMQDVFTHSHPTVPDAALHMRTLFGDVADRAPADLGLRLRSSAEILFTFSFKPHYSFVGTLPIFGSLFTLCLPLALFVRQGGRLWVGIFVSLGTLASWALTYRIDRNLQTFAPILIATTAAVLVRAQEAGRLARVGVAALVFAQLASSGDLFFSGTDRIGSSMGLIRSTLDGRAGSRYDRYKADYVELGRALPKDALVVMHSWHPSLGIDRPALLDWIGFQGLIDYRPFRSARDLYERFHALGVTHIVARPCDRPAASKQEEVIFAMFSARHAGKQRTFGELQLFDMPTRPPPVEEPYEVLARGLAGYSNGLYRVDDLSTCERMPWEMQKFRAPRTPLETPAEVESALTHVRVLLLAHNAPISPAARETVAREFERVIGYPDFAVYVRRK